MKKLRFLLLTLILLLGFCGCANQAHQDPILSSLPDYNNKEFYASGSFQDYTDYAKYTYGSVTAEALESSTYFTVTTSADLAEILLHIDNFEGWVETIGGEFKKNYDFDRSIVTEGDFFHIETKDEDSIGQGTYSKFDNYSVYYFDIDSQILYYFHNSI